MSKPLEELLEYCQREADYYARLLPPWPATNTGEWLAIDRASQWRRWADALAKATD